MEIKWRSTHAQEEHTLESCFLIHIMLFRQLLPRNAGDDIAIYVVSAEQRVILSKTTLKITAV